MPKVTLRYSVFACDNTAHLFEKEVELPSRPIVADVIRDPGLPMAVNTPLPVEANENVVARVVLDTAGNISADLYSGRDGAMTAEELTKEYAKYGWRYMRLLTMSRQPADADAQMGEGEDGD